MSEGRASPLFATTLTKGTVRLPPFPSGKVEIFPLSTKSSPLLIPHMADSGLSEPVISCFGRCVLRSASNVQLEPSTSRRGTNLFVKTSRLRVIPTLLITLLLCMGTPTI